MKLESDLDNTVACYQLITIITIPKKGKVSFEK